MLDVTTGGVKYRASMFVKTAASLRLRLVSPIYCKLQRTVFVTCNVLYNAYYLSFTRNLFVNVKFHSA